MIDERGVITAGAERANAKIGPRTRILLFLRAAMNQPPGLPTLPYRDVLFRIIDIPGHAVDEFLQRVRTFNAKIAAAITVCIDIDCRMLLQFLSMVFSPFGGTQQHGFFTVPRAINDGALRLPTMLQENAQRAGFFQ